MARMCTVQHSYGRAAYYSFFQGQVGNPEVWFLRIQFQCTSVVVCVWVAVAWLPHPCQIRVRVSYTPAAACSHTQ